MKLGSAGAILVLWSGYSRHSEYVRSEAATGLYKNKLIQVSLDGEGAPRPFDGIDVIDIAGWTGERDHPQWRRMIDAVRLYAGAPGSARPLVQRRAVSGPPAYLEPRRQMAWGPIVAAGLLMSGGAGIWMADPFGWRATRTAVAEPVEAGSEAALAAAELAESAAVPRVYEDTEASQTAWDRVDRKDPDALRDYAADFPNSTSAETARSLLRVLDAQAWVDAVTSDNENGYQGYLKKFRPMPPRPARWLLLHRTASARFVSSASRRSWRSRPVLPHSVSTGARWMGARAMGLCGRCASSQARTGVRRQRCLPLLRAIFVRSPK
jgi:hypothetical protein